MEVSFYNITFLVVLFCSSTILPTSKHNLSLLNFTQNEECQIISILKELKVYKRKNIVIRKSELEPLVLGLTAYYYDGCIIDLSPIIFYEPEYFKPAIYHEIGHCFGLDHVEDKRAIMYKEARSNEEYTDLEWQQFISQLESCF